MLAEPKVLLCDEPTRDVGARREIYTLLRRLSEGGRPVVLLSADSAELAGLCDTVLIFSRGRVVRTLTSTKPRRAAGLRARLSRSDLAPGGVVLAAVIVLALITGANQPTYLQSLNLSLLLYAGTALILVALGQLLVVLTAGIDLSVGPLAGMLVVVMSYVADGSTSAGGLALGLLITFAVAAAVGLVNGLLIAVVKMPPHCRDAVDLHCPAGSVVATAVDSRRVGQHRHDQVAAEVVRAGSAGIPAGAGDRTRGGVLVAADPVRVCPVFGGKFTGGRFPAGCTCPWRVGGCLCRLLVVHLPRRGAARRADRGR